MLSGFNAKLKKPHIVKALSPRRNTPVLRVCALANKFFETTFRRPRDNRFILTNAFLTGGLLYITVDAAIGAGPFAANACRQGYIPGRLMKCSSSVSVINLSQKKQISPTREAITGSPPAPEIR